MPDAPNLLYYGDNLKILREKVATESVDLIYLDPPFNSNRNFNVLFKNKHDPDQEHAQIQAFDDTWTWTQEADRLYFDMVASGGAPSGVAEALQAMHSLLGENDMLAYLVMMAARLVELHRVLKPTGSLYLHCDPTASHYLKVLLDAVFGPERFRGEITWLRTTTHNDAKRWSPNADIILYYGKGGGVTWNPVHIAHSAGYVDDKYRFDDGDGRRYMLDNMTSPNPRPNLTYEWMGHAPPPNGWRYSLETMTELDSQGRIWYPDSKEKRPRLKRYLDEQAGPVVGNVWTDISPINSRAAERLGYPTQKPLALLERIIEASSNPGDVVLDPFCGCGTAVVAAERLGRRWVGIDIAYIAVDLIARRLLDSFGTESAFEVHGSPQDVAGAEALFQESHFEFERWAVSLVWGQPKDRPGGDQGIDGIIRFPMAAKNETGKVVVSIKGGASVNPGFVRDLKGTVEREKAEMGVLVCLTKPTKGMVTEAQHSGSYTWPVNGEEYPKIQILTIEELLDGERVKMPTALMPYIQAQRHIPASDQASLAL